MMEIYVGTSGWMYPWNEGGSLDWYINYSGLNAVELNASFYRFPFQNAINSWKTKGSSLRWSVKVNQLITHKFKFNEKAFEAWMRFKELFRPMDHLIDFYLFQLPPLMSISSQPRIEAFVDKTGLKGRFALEPRNITWFNDTIISWASNIGITLVSVDCPDLPQTIFNVNGIIYERMHGRTIWYGHYYSTKELKEVAERIIRMGANKAYIFFNNDHGMLENSKEMLNILRRLNKGSEN